MQDLGARPFPSTRTARSRAVHHTDILVLEEVGAVAPETRDDETWSQLVRRVVVRRVRGADPSEARRRDEIVAERLLALTFDLS